MKTKNNGVVDSVPGTESSKKVLKLEDVKGLLKRDLNACLHMLAAIHDDPDTLDRLAETMHGKYMNSLHKAELDNQLEIKP